MDMIASIAFIVAVLIWVIFLEHGRYPTAEDIAREQAEEAARERHRQDCRELELLRRRLK
jgi:hypothetical protein